VKIYKEYWAILYIKANIVSVYGDKQGRVGAVTFAFSGRYLLAGQGRGGYVCISKSLSSSSTWQGRGRAARADTRPLDLLAIYKILGENWGTCI
jgi:hypothetical protein